MQTSFDNGKPNLEEGNKNYMGKIFSKISKEVEFFSSLTLHFKQCGLAVLPSLLFPENCLYEVKLSGCSRNCHSQSH